MKLRFSLLVALCKILSSKLLRCKSLVTVALVSLLSIFITCYFVRQVRHSNFRTWVRLFYQSEYTSTLLPKLQSNFSFNESVLQLMSGLQPDAAPINQYLYPFIISSEHKCKTKNATSEIIKLLLVVKSSVIHFKRREAIRQTWGWEQRFPEVSIRRIFNLGLIANESLMRKVKKEQKTFGDIVQGGFVDNYYNNTIKTMMGIRWVVENCGNLEFVFFVDDDYYVSMKNLLRFISNPLTYPNVSKAKDDILDESDLKSPKSSTNHLNLFAGLAYFNGTPIRKPSSKWYLSPSIYPYERFPPFVTAGAMVMTIHTVRLLYYTSMYTPHFPFDDVFLGLVALNAGLMPLNNRYFDNTDHIIPRDFKLLIAAHGYGKIAEKTDLWKEQFRLQNA